MDPTRPANQPSGAIAHDCPTRTSATLGRTVVYPSHGANVGGAAPVVAQVPRHSTPASATSGALGASLEAAMAPAARPDCAMQPVRGVPSNVSSQSYIGCPPGFRVDEATPRICRTLRYVGFAPLSASLAAAMPPAARPDCAMQPVPLLAKDQVD